MNPHHLLFFSLEDWNEVWRRNQFICAELSRRYPTDLQILWVSPVVDAPYSLARKNLRELASIKLTPHAVPGFDKIKVLKPVKLLPNKIGKGFNDSLLQRSIEAALKTMAWTEFDVWVNAQQARNYLPRLAWRKLFYDITDDWTKMPQPARQLRYVIEDDTAMLEKADHVIVCSQSLFESKKDRCRAISLIANGVDDERYHPSALSKLDIPNDMKAITRPIAGYTGTLHSSRLDLNLIELLTAKLNAVNFVFVGPNCLTDEETTRISRANVHILGSRPYAELASYIACFDLCMTPHLVNEFTESLDPLKLYEYMSTGLPIVSTPCAGFRDHQDQIHIAGDAAEFAGNILACLENSGNTGAGARIEWAAQQSWAKRVDDVVSILSW